MQCTDGSPVAQHRHDQDRAQLDEGRGFALAVFRIIKNIGNVRGPALQNFVLKRPVPSSVNSPPRIAVETSPDTPCTAEQNETPRPRGS